MIKRIFRSIVINFFSLYFLPSLVSSVSFVSGIKTIITAAVILTAVNFIAKPLVKLVMLPVNIITLGALSWLSNVFVIYLTVTLAPGFSISPFNFTGYQYQGFNIPAISFSYFWTIVLISFYISTVYSLVSVFFDA